MVTRKTRLTSALLSVLMVLTMLAGFVVPMSAESSYPSVTTVTAEVTGTDYSIANASDWMYVFNNLAWFNKDGVTLHLSGNVDFKGAATFTGFVNPMFSFDGHGYTISNWGTEAAPVTTPGMFAPDYGYASSVDFIKNVTLENCYAKASRNSCIALIYSAGHSNGGANLPETFTMENVHVKDSSFTAAGGQVHGILLARYANSTESTVVNITNCSIVGTTFDVTAADEHNGLVVGKPRGNNTADTTGVYNITDLKLVRNTIIGANQGTGLIFGTVEDSKTTVNLKNAIAIDNTMNVKEGVGVGVVGASVEGKLNIQDSIFQNSGAVGTNIGVHLLGNGYGSTPQLTGLSNVYLSNDITLVEGKTTDLAAVTDSAKLLEAAYKANQGGYTNKWTITNGLVDADGEGVLPVKATIKCDSGSDEVLYGVQYGTLTLNYGGTPENIAGYSIVAPANGATVSGSTLTLGSSDIVITASLMGLNYADLDEAVAAFEGKNTAYYASSTYEQSLADLLAEIAAKREGETFADQDEVSSYIVKLKTYALDVYPNLPLASEVDQYADANDYLVNSLGELEYVAKNPTKYAAADTIHLGAEITVTAGSAANRLGNFSAKIDGHGYAIKGVTFDGNNVNLSSWIDTYTGSYIGNLVVDGWTLTNMGWKGGLLIGYATGASSLTVENITVKNCAMDKASNYGSFTIADCDTASLTLKNINIIDNTFTRGTGTGNSGLLLGRYNKGAGTLDVDDIYISGNTVNGVVIKNGIYSSGAGLVIGEVTAAKTTVNNVITVNTTIGEGHEVNGLLFGRVKGASPVVDNVVIEAGAWAALPVARLQKTDNVHDANNAATVTVTNLYTDATNLTTGDLTAANTPVAAAEIHNGAVAFALNAAGVEKTYVITEDGIAFGAEGKPVQVILVAGEQTIATLYTDVNGKLIGLTDEMINAANWGVDLTTAVYNENTTVTGVLVPEFVVGDVAGKNGDTLDVSVSIKNNPGFVGAEIKVSYDATALQLAGLAKGDVDVLPVVGNPVVADGVATVEIALIALDGNMPTDITTDGVIGYLQFKILDAAKPGNYDVTVESIEIVNKAEKVIDVKTAAGTVTVECNFQLVAPSNDTAPEEAAHYYACTCGEVQTSEKCSETEGWQYEKIDSTCTEEGSLTASCAVCGYNHSSVISKKSHATNVVEAKEPSCEEAGNNEYYLCDTCGKAFKDAEGTQETTVEAETLPATDHAYPRGWTHVEGTDTHTKVCANGCGKDLIENCGGEWTVEGEEKVKTCPDCGNVARAPLAPPTTLEVEAETATPGKTVALKLSVKDNAGLSGAKITVTYDASVLGVADIQLPEGALVDIGPETHLGAGTEVATNIVFVLPAEMTEDGVFATLILNVDTTAEIGEHAIKIDVEAAGYDLAEYTMTYTGTVTVEEPAYLPGDINGDGKVSISDAVMMMRVAAGDAEVIAVADLVAGNVTTEGDTAEMVINTNDIILVLQYLNGTVKEL
ncbi:MAG: hypothetical protein IJ043_01720 [Clostridia bacterium]|nr:hypothetical protein [Clostridia bacterium]